MIIEILVLPHLTYTMELYIYIYSPEISVYIVHVYKFFIFQRCKTETYIKYLKCISISHHDLCIS